MSFTQRPAWHARERESPLPELMHSLLVEHVSPAARLGAAAQTPFPSKSSQNPLVHASSS